MRKSLIPIILVALACAGTWTTQAATVSGKVSDVTGQAVTTNTFVRFELKNCSSNIPRVVGQSIFVPASKDLVPNALGALGGTVVSNDIITCDVLGNTFYHVSVWNGQALLFQSNFYITGQTWDLAAATPISSDPTAFMAFTTYVTGDMLIASGLNHLSTLHGNALRTRKFVGMNGDGTLPTTWDWYPIRIDDLPDGIPAEKIVGLQDIIKIGRASWRERV